MVNNICIITPPRYLSETFIRAQEDRLTGNKVILTVRFPEYFHNGHPIQYFYNRHKRFRRLFKVLPHWLYEKNKSRFEPENEATYGALSEFFGRHRVKVILAEYGFTGADITPIARALQIPLVVHFHGHDAYHLQYLREYESRFREMFAYASHVVSVSQDMTEQLVRLGAPRDKVVDNPYGPREYFYDVRPDYSDTLISVGRFAETKAPHLTVSAFKMLADECPEAKLIMVGDGPLREFCVSLAEGLGIRHKIDFTGALDHSYTRELLSKSCCFVQHSITTSEGVCEGTPVAILEAGAAGLPVVSTRHAGIKEAVVHGKTGFLVEEKDVVGMKNHMRTLLQDKNLCRSMGENARAYIRQHYRIDQHIGCLQQLLDQRCR